ncbi:MAG: hypothetical protein K2J20_01115, partial [Bacilli bacterium]|nr:hypothetical protein [Bacilli bacterium]
MTYLQIIKSALTLGIQGKINDEILDACYDTKDLAEARSLIQEEAKMCLTYFSLYLMNSQGLLSKDAIKLMNFLDEELAITIPSITKTFAKAAKKAEATLNQDENLIAISEILENGDFQGEEEQMAKDILFDASVHALLSNLDHRELEEEVLVSALEDVIDCVVTALADLFFSTNGYQYLSPEYHISNEVLRNKCFNYVRSIITDYFYERYSDD